MPGLRERYEASLAYYKALQSGSSSQSAEGTASRTAKATTNNSAQGSTNPSTPAAGSSNGSPAPAAASTQPKLSSGQTAGSPAVTPQPQSKSAASTKTSGQTSQAAAGSTARTPQPIKPATPPVLTGSTAKPPPVAPAPSATPASNLKSEVINLTGGQPAANPNDPQPQAGQDQAGTSQTSANLAPPSGQAVPTARAPQAHSGPGANPLPNPHHGQPNYPHPSTSAGPSLGGLPPRPFNLNLPPQRYIPSPQAAPPPPPPIPIELEKDRRKRKIREYLAEEAPGMEIESGIYNVSLCVAALSIAPNVMSRLS